MCEPWMMEHVVDGLGVADAGILQEPPRPAEAENHLPGQITASILLPLDLMSYMATLVVEMAEFGPLPAVMAEVVSDAN